MSGCPPSSALLVPCTREGSSFSIFTSRQNIPSNLRK
ncbi:UNVERIFIED_CONTAM: hypothetical protein GTU68_059118 [Idotea baltica]|nr:hypothetical protein [Idotea baltica]